MIVLLLILTFLILVSQVIHLHAAIPVALFIKQTWIIAEKPLICLCIFQLSLLLIYFFILNFSELDKGA